MRRHYAKSHDSGMPLSGKSRYDMWNLLEEPTAMAVSAARLSNLSEYSEEELKKCSEEVNSSFFLFFKCFCLKHQFLPCFRKNRLSTVKPNTMWTWWSTYVFRSMHLDSEESTKTISNYAAILVDYVMWARFLFINKELQFLYGYNNSCSSSLITENFYFFASLFSFTNAQICYDKIWCGAKVWLGTRTALHWLVWKPFDRCALEEQRTAPLSVACCWSKLLFQRVLFIVLRDSFLDRFILLLRWRVWFYRKCQRRRFGKRCESFISL